MHGSRNFPRENEAGRGGLRDNYVGMEERGGGVLKGLFVGILLCEINIFEFSG